MNLRALIDRLSEPSTYGGLAAIALAAGVAEHDWAAWSAAAATLFGVIAAFLGERKPNLDDDDITRLARELVEPAQPEDIE